jgi:excisionase family DNA binding protein
MSLCWNVDPQKKRVWAESGFATVKEAAEFLRLSRAKIYQLLETGELASVHFGRSRRIPRAALYDYAERHLTAE